MDLSEFVPPLLNIGPEGELQREIKDVMDELDIMLHLTHQQKEVIKRFKKNVEHLMDPQGRWIASPQSPNWFPGQANGTQAGKEELEETRKRDNHQWFRVCAEDLLCDVEDRIEELEGLLKSAGSTSASVRLTTHPVLQFIPRQSGILQSMLTVSSRSWITCSGSNSSRLP